MVCRAAAGCRNLREAAIDPLRHPGRGPARPRTAGAPPLDGVLDEGVTARGAKGSGRQGKASSAAIAAQRLGGGRNVALSVAQARRRAEPGLLARMRGRMPRVRPLRAVTISVFSLALVGIVANAMVFQHGRHPAPLFGLGRSIDGQPEVGQQAAAPAPAPLPAERTGSLAPPPAPAVVEPRPEAVAPKPVAPVHRAAVPKPRHEDGIGSLLAPGSAAPVAHPRPGSATAQKAPVRRSEPKPEAKTAEAPVAQRAADHRAASEAAGILEPGRTHPTKVPASTAHPRPHAKPVGAAARTEPAPKSTTPAAATTAQKTVTKASPRSKTAAEAE